VQKLLMGILLGALLSGCTSGSKAGAGDSHGAAPEFDLQRIAGGNLSSKDLRGKVAVVDFWATWCDPCKEEIPAYNKLADSLPAGAVMMGIAMDSGSFDEVKEAVGNLKIQYPVLFGKDNIEEKFLVHGFPTTFIVDKDWKIYKKYEGTPKGKTEKIQQDIAALLAK